MRVSLVIPAAGSGSRLGCDLPKAFAPVAGACLLQHSLAALRSALRFAETVVLAPPEFISRFAELLANSGFEDVRVRAGGATRQDSVRLGLAALAAESDLVCVHDAARPLVSAQTVLAVVSAAERCGAATAASAVVDSVRRRGADGASATVDRSDLWLVETPQVFARERLLAAHERALACGLAATDDAALVEAAGWPVEVVASEGGNPKVTLPLDLDLVALVLERRTAG